MIKDDEILTLSVNAGSYDGRYWGPLKKDRIVGYAKAIF
ncbi:S26 family signal peptidase [Thiolapillus sp.]